MACECDVPQPRASVGRMLQKLVWKTPSRQALSMLFSSMMPNGAKLKNEVAGETMLDMRLFMMYKVSPS